MRPGLALLVALAAACDTPASATVVMSATAAPPAYGTTPFPTDAVRAGDRLGAIAGLEVLVARHAALVTSHIAELDGFGLRPLVEFFVTGALDPATVPARTTALTDAAALVDVDPSSPERGRVIAMEWRFDEARGVLAGSPELGTRLREGTRYAAFVTTALRDARGTALRRAAALDELARHAPARWQTTAEALAALETGSLGALAPGAEIAGITVLTTQHATAPLRDARVVLDALAPPALAFPDPDIVFAGSTALDRVLGQATRAPDGPRAGLERWGNDNPTGLAHDHVGVLGTGEMTIARFRRDDIGTNDPHDETFTSPPTVIATDTIPVTFILPATPMPAAGYPVVIFGHGLGAGREQLLVFAEPLTSQGFALVGIDMSGHGSRFDPTDQLANAAILAPEFTGEPSTRDGIADNTGLTTTFEFFEGFLNVSAVRDSIRQSALDLVQVSRLIRRPDLDLTALAGPGADVPRLDTRRVAYLGESFGTVVGTVFAAIEPAVDLYVLDVPGGGILDILLPTSAEIGSLALPLIESIYGPRSRLDRWNPLIGLMQAVIDGADPLTYAPHVLADRFTIGGAPLGPRSVVCIQVVGDQVLSNAGTEALARGFGLAVLAPHLEVPDGLVDIASPAAGNRDGQTAVLVQYAPATHGGNWAAERGMLRHLPGFPHDGDQPFPRLPAPITIANPIYETHAQVAEILHTHQAGEPPRVRSTLAPVADFDGDGVPDDIDPWPYDPTR
jgi:hypothetical protein